MSPGQQQVRQIGYITDFFAGVALIEGLPFVRLHEVLVDKQGQEVGIVIGFTQEYVEALFFREDFDTAQAVFGTGEIFAIPQTQAYRGGIYDALGKPLYGSAPVRGRRASVFAPALEVTARDPITVPLTTGIKVIDTTLPLGRGQRELIIGDRKTGKSTLAIDIVLNQKDTQPPVYSIYVLCGQKRDKLERLIALFNEYGAFDYTTIVAAPAGSSFAQQYLAPFVGTAIGEFFRDQGQDALIVYDDLSKHAKVYRDISLLLRRAPGRETYPGDIFYLHAQLLERAGRRKSREGGSLTALPIIETQEGDITGFIPTNLISITDGQIYLERALAQKGFLPAVNVGLSVSRLGGYVQPAPLSEVVGGVRLALAQHKQLQRLVQLESVVSNEAQKKIYRGELILELLKQQKHTNISWEEQVILFYAVEAGFFDNLPAAKWQEFEQLLLELVRTRFRELIVRIGQGKFNQKIKQGISQIAADFQQEFFAKDQEER